MCVDISKSLFRNLASQGIVLSEGLLKTLRAVYLQVAQEAIRRYEDDAAINSLKFDRHQERTAVEAFLKGIKLATDVFLEDPLGVPMISNWSRVAAAVPDIFDRLAEAVEQDQAMRFKQSLERDERFQKVFRYIDVALSAGDVGGGGPGGSGGGRTRFTISCKGKSGG